MFSRITSRRLAPAVLAVFLATPFALIPVPARACSACGCNLDTDEAGSPVGWSVDERVDYVNQNALWLGGGTAPPQKPTVVEVQRNTTTIYYTTTIDYQSDKPWGVNVAVPAQYRTHSTENDTVDAIASKSSWNALGDMRALGRYALPLGQEVVVNLLLGVKLPTGQTNRGFSGGPTAGNAVDRGLQPGSGTWDTLLGLNQSGKFTDKLGWFSQQLWQRPIARYQGFSEGQKINGSVGVRYTMNDTFTPQLQLNGQYRFRDKGVNADIPNSGGNVVYASPGLFVNVRADTTVYGFVQIPVYQRVGGLELVPDYSASFGIKYKF
ncbi:MAG: hypothetical protein HQL37_13425 [Alphaproteobacteria bacterium]|nr:hypothetical protein [Alphaproteobacteria bacterium]